ncbi:MAG TPA: DUF4922 domain-containing protein [Bacteroidales bacterium]|nr:DUF4922 domain-containing protein [Bacteroidales bacterium]
MTNTVEQLLIEQLAIWETARNNFEALKQVKTKELNVNGAKFYVQFNPARIVSSGAKVDAKSIQERKCFLCAENRPREQVGLKVPLGKFRRQERLYSILVNPFPIFPKHFTIPDMVHKPQLILSRFGDMLDLAEYMKDYVIFYNGPKCGASAPDHVHFQAGNKGFLPIEKEWKKHIEATIIDNDNIKLHKVNYGFPLFLFETNDKKKGIELFKKIYNALPLNDSETEPMMNILVWVESPETQKKSTSFPLLGKVPKGIGAGGFRGAIIPRAKHRPDCYFAEGEKNILLSPASVDLGGVLITPLEKDFEKITAEDVAEILAEVCFDEKTFKKVIQKIQ